MADTFGGGGNGDGEGDGDDGDGDGDGDDDTGRAGTWFLMEEKVTSKTFR